MSCKVNIKYNPVVPKILQLNILYRGFNPNLAVSLNKSLVSILVNNCESALLHVLFCDQKLFRIYFRQSFILDTILLLREIFILTVKIEISFTAID